MVQENVLLEPGNEYSQFIYDVVMVQELYSKRPVMHRNLSQSCSDSLLEEWSWLSETDRPSSGLPDERLNGEPYFIDRKEAESVGSVLCKVNCMKRQYVTATCA
jgi:hypothetical protein